MEPILSSVRNGSMIHLPEHFSEIATIVIICIIFGGFGGLVAHFINSERPPENGNSEEPYSHPFPSPSKSICIGVAGAIGFLFFMIAAGGIAASFQGLTAYLRVISTSVIAGFGARSLLSKMADHLAKQIAEAQSTADAAIAESKENEERIDLLETNMKLIEAADGPSTKATLDEAIKRGEEIIRAQRANASTWIHLARCYRWNSDLKSAIKTLDDFIKLSESGKFEKSYLNPAYYNRGCYFALLYKDAQDQNYLESCLADLESALRTCSDAAKEVALIWADEDWNHLANENSFTKIVGQRG